MIEPMQFEPPVIVAAGVGFLLGGLTVMLVVAIVQRIERHGRDGKGDGENARSVPTSVRSDQTPVLNVGPLTDEEQIIALLSSSGGGLPQSRIVESTGWSKAKVSRLLTEMERRGAVQKVPRGRENLVLLRLADSDEGEGREP